MSLADLIRKRDTGNLATAIPAISATQPKGEAGTVARIATVAVANPKGEKTAPPAKVGAGGDAISLSNLIRGKSEPVRFATAISATRKDEGGRTVANPLSIEEETAIRAWFTSIGEDDPATIADTLAQCQTDSVGRAYLLKEAAHAQHNSTAPLANQWISCGACKHFRRIAIHPHLGRCSRGKPEGTAGLWDSTVRWCAEGAAS